MIHIYCPRPSESARMLVNTLRQLGQRVRRQMHVDFRARPEDTVVCWGWPRHHDHGGVRLNAQRGVANKYDELVKLAAAGVRVPKHSLQAQGDGWVGRSLQHEGGNDFLVTRPRYDYWTKIVRATKEYRVHVWKGKIMRIADKRHRRDQEWLATGRQPHEWCRTWDAGWFTAYGFPHGEVPRGIRQACRDALTALGLDFGAVDVGWLPSEERPVVFEVNRAPGLGPNTARLYCNKIVEVVNGTC